MRALSLFSGAGGLDLGFKLAGFDVVFANDADPTAAETYAVNFGLRLEHCDGRRAEARPGAVLACPVEQVDFAGLPGADVLLGGPPCQDFSVVRGPEARGTEVRRGRLYAHFVRALAALQPKAFVFENVPGLARVRGGAYYTTILEDLKRLDARWPEIRKLAGGNGKPQSYEVLFAGVVDFSRLGVPQRRERLIIIGVRRDLVHSLDDMWKLRSLLDARLSGAGLPFAKYPLTPLEAFEGRPLPDLQAVYREVMGAWEGVWEEVGTEKAWRWKRDVWDRLTFDAVRDYLAANGVQPLSEEELEEAWRAHEAALRELGYRGAPVSRLKPPDGTNELPPEDPAVAERMARIPPGEWHDFVRGTPWEVEGRGIKLVYRRLHPLKPAYTVVARGGGGTHGYHYDRGRATLTLRERARLQTFPDWFLFAGGRRRQRAQIGEAVPPLAARRIAEALAEALRTLEA